MAMMMLSIDVTKVTETQQKQQKGHSYVAILPPSKRPLEKEKLLKM